MILLSIDTSGKDGSITLARGGEDVSGEGIEILDTVPLAGGTFSAQLVPQIAALLAKHERTKSEIGAFAAASGPGSFTGLRVGLAAIKALAEILEKPIVAISRLEALARMASARGRIMAALDAGRGEVYAGEYQSGERIELVDEKLLSLDDFLAQSEMATVITPEQKIADAAQKCGLKIERVDRPTSKHIARIGWEAIQQGKSISPEELEANYIRRSDAEIFAKKG
jgi:tRNA threonylcarbamoyladenosine biosynthesis protein TsaB